MTSKSFEDLFILTPGIDVRKFGNIGQCRKTSVTEYAYEKMMKENKKLRDIAPDLSSKFKHSLTHLLGLTPIQQIYVSNDLQLIDITRDPEARKKMNEGNITIPDAA